MQRALSLGVISAAVLAGLLGSSGPWVASAHPGPHLPSPPTHDYDTVIPGTQGPTSPLLANPTGHLFSPLRLSVTTIVPLEDLQTVLPPGFTANPLAPPNPPGLAGMALNFHFLDQCDRAGGGPSLSASGMYAFHSARNTALGRNELLALAAEFGDQSWLDCHHAMLGPGGSRLAEVEAEVKQKHGQLSMKFDVEDEETGLRVKVRAEGSGAFNARNNHADPSGNAVRTLDQGLFINPAYRFSFMADGLSVPITNANFKLTLGKGDEEDATLGRIALPGGSVRVVGLMPNFAFTRWFENFFQPE
jgi:hypothetical protein